MPNITGPLPPNIGSRQKIDELLRVMPQEAIAGVDEIKQVGRKVLVPCMDFSELETDRSVADLEPRHYEYLLLMAHGATWREVAIDLGRSVSSIRDYCAATHKVLGVRAIEEAALHIPVPEDQLKKKSLWKVDNGRFVTPILNEAEKTVWDDAAAGILTPASAQRHDRTPSTVRNHKSAIYKKLGIRNRAELTRIAGAMSYAPRYETSESVIHTVAGLLQPKVIKAVEIVDKSGNGDIRRRTLHILRQDLNLYSLMWGPAAHLAMSVVSHEVRCYLGSQAERRAA